MGCLSSKDAAVDSGSSEVELAGQNKDSGNNNKSSSNLRGSGSESQLNGDGGLDNDDNKQQQQSNNKQVFGDGAGAFGDPFDLHYALTHVSKHLPLGVRTYDFVEALKMRWTALDKAQCGHVTQRQLKEFVWTSNGHELSSLPAKLPGDLQTQMDAIIQGTGGADSFTFLQFANMLLAAETGDGGASRIPVPSGAAPKNSKRRLNGSSNGHGLGTEQNGTTGGSTSSKGYHVGGGGGDGGGSNGNLNTPESFSLERSLSHIRRKLPPHFDGETFLAKLREQWTQMDVVGFGEVVEDDVRAYFWRKAGNDGDPPQHLPDDIQRSIDEMFAGTGSKGFFTFWDLVNLLLRDQPFNVYPPDPDEVLVENDDEIPHGPFKLVDDLVSLRRQLEPLGAERAEKFLENLLAHWKTLDPKEKGVVTREELRVFVWETDMEGPVPNILPRDMQEQVVVIMTGTGNKAWFTFWDFAQFLLTAEGDHGIELVPPTNDDDDEEAELDAAELEADGEDYGDDDDDFDDDSKQ